MYQNGKRFFRSTRNEKRWRQDPLSVEHVTRYSKFLKQFMSRPIAHGLAVAFVAGLYMGAFALLHSRFGDGVTALSLIWVALAGWFFGRTPGIIAGLAAVLLNVLLLKSTDDRGWVESLIANGFFGSIMLVVCGWAFGKLHEFNHTLRDELDTRRNTEYSLKHTSSLLKTAIESTNGGIAVTDLKGNLLTFSNNFPEMMGLTANLQEGSRLRIRFLANQVARPQQFLEFIMHVLEHPFTEGRITLELVTGNSVECVCRPHLMEAQPVGLVWSFTDITGERRSQTALLHSQRQMRALMDNSIDGIVMTDEEGRLVEWNAGMEAISGLTRTETQGMRIWEVFERLSVFENLPHHQVEADRERFREVLSGTRTVKPGLREYAFKRPDGQPRVLEIMTFSIPTDLGTLIGGVARDITDRKAAEKALMESSELNNTLLNASTDAVFLVDTDLNLLAVNQGFANRLSSQPGQWIGVNLSEITDHETAIHWRELIHTALSTRQQAIRDIKLQTRWYHTKACPILDGSGQVARVAVFSTDITTTRQHERMLEAVASVSSALRSTLTQADVFPVVIDQVEHLMDADGVGLVIKNDLGLVRVEQARGAWTALMNHTYTIEEATRGPVLIMDQPYLNNDIATAQQLFHTRPFEGIKATACMPIAIEGNVVGCLWIGCRTAIDQSEMRILAALADIAASSLHRARLHEQSLLNTQQLSIASDIGRILSQTLSLQEVYVRLAESLYHLLPDIASVIISRFNPVEKNIVCVYALEDGKLVDVSQLPALPLRPPNEGTQSQVIHTAQPVLKNNMADYMKQSPHITIGDRTRVTQSALYVPILAKKSEVLGVLQVQSYTNFRFTHEDIAFLSLTCNTAAIAIQNAILFEDLQRSNQDLTHAYRATLEAWSRALDLRDRGTAGHTNRVLENTIRLGQMMGMNETELDNLRRGAQLHDIGKMGVPDSILLKPDRLTEEEWAVMRMHPEYAHQMLHPVPEFRSILDVPYCHHEKWDGSGYPRGLRGEEIPLAARVFAVVDVWDALRSDRPYRPAWSEERVIEYIRNQAGHHFDPRVVAAFLEIIQQHPS